MANVFGDPITDWTLKGMKEYINSNITAVDRARLATHKKNADMKDKNARTYLEELKDKWKVEFPNRACTLFLVYNATGNTMTLFHNTDRAGHIGQAPYPIEIQNGQWGAFLHVQDQESGASAARIAYRSEDLRVVHKLEWLNSTARHWVWAATRENINTNDIWDNINEGNTQSRYYFSESSNGWSSTITTGGNTTPVVEATFTKIPQHANNA